MELDSIRFAETELREEAWDPLEWVYLLGGGIFPLLAREFAPLAERLASVAGRLEGIPAVVEAARSEIVGRPGRPVSRFHTETALRQLSGVTELADEALEAARAAASADPAVAAVLPRLEAAAAIAATAMATFETHLRDVVLPVADGEGRLGAGLFATKMRHTLRDPDLTPARVLERAEREYASVRAEMIRLARDLWPTWCPGRDLPDRRAGNRPRGPRRDRGRASGGRRPARVVPGRARPDRGVLPRAGPRRAGRGPARDPLDAGLPPLLRRGDARHAGPARPGPEGVLRDHPDPGRLDRRAGRELPPRGQRPDAPTAHDPRGRARATTSRARHANRNPSLAAGGLLERRLRRGLGRLRHPGDDGRGLRRRRSGAPPDPLEVLPAGGHERDHRRPDPRRRGLRRRR